MSGVYILHDPATDYLKIGRATRLEDRLNNLRTANPRLVLLEWIETVFDSAVESYVHNRLASYRKEGEFFEVGIEMIRQEINDALAIMNQRPADSALKEITTLSDVGQARDPAAEELSWLSEILRIRSELEKLELKESMLLDRLKVSIGKSSGLNHWATFSPVTRQSLDSTALRNDFPELYEKYLVRSVSRTLKIQPFIRQKERTDQGPE